MRWRTLLLPAAALLSWRAGRNYPDLLGPRHAGDLPAGGTARAAREALRIVSFNVEYALAIDSAIEVLTLEPALRDADIVLLQEMDDAGTRRIAAALGMCYVYYPAIFRTRAGRDFGNAVLSRWPVVDDAKLALPHPSRYAGTQRTATAATLAIGERRVRVYSAHLGTPLDIGGAARADQLRVLLRDAKRFEHVVIGGDMNSSTVGRLAEEHGYTWATREGPRTMRLGRWDHVFLRGFGIPATQGSGTVLDARNSSDHLPVWAVGLLPPT